MGLSTEVLMIIFFVLSILLLITIYNLIGIIKLEKNKKEIQRVSEEYIQNREKIFSKYKLIMAIILIVEIAFYILNNLSMCNCGYTEFKSFPIAISIIIQIIANIMFIKLAREKEYTISYFIKYICICIILFVLVAVFSKNDVDALHRSFMVR